MVAPQPAEISASTASGTTAAVSQPASSCSVPEIMYQELNDILVKMQGIDAEKNAGEYNAYEQKIEKINQEINNARQNCANPASGATAGGAGAPTAATNVNVAAPQPAATATTAAAVAAAPTATNIYGYYKEKVNSAMEGTGDASSKIEELKAIRGEIDSLIGKLIQGQNTVNAADISPLVSTITVMPTSVSADSVKVETTGKQVTVNVKGENVQVRQSEGSVVVEDAQGGSASAPSAVIRNSTIWVGNGEVRVLPSQAVANEYGVLKKLGITDENGTAVYSATIETKARILGIFPATYEKTKTISAENGQTLKEEKPWWAAISTEEK